MQPTTIHPDAARSDVVPAKFAYASGSRPLEGYTIKRGVGSGGFGEVYYATSDGGKDVALKLIRRNLDIELRGVRQCLNLKHPNLLGLFDVRVDSQGSNWVVMEYVAGQCLEEVLATHPNGLPLAEALDWFRGVAGAVAYLHDHGIVHRDLKPGNIFRDQGIVKLGDYGLTKFISVSRRSGQTESIGTVHYMAPEIANGRYGKEIDLYALGILLYELLTGHVPFEGESVGEVLMKHLTAEPDLGRLAEPYRSLVRDCLAKDPTARPRSATELVARLDGSVPPQQPGYTAPPARPVMPPTIPAYPAAPHDNSVATAWHELPPIAKVVLGGAGCMATFLMGGPIFTVIFVLVASSYLNKRRPIAMPSVAAPYVPRPIPVPYPAVPPLHSSLLNRAKQVRAKAALVLRSPRQRWADLLSSLLAAPLIAAVIVAMVTIFRGGQDAQPALVAWQWSVAALGSWLVLVLAKLWEGNTGDPWRRRFAMLLVGLALGAFAWWLDDYLFLDLHYGEPILHDLKFKITDSGYAPNGQPLLTGYLRYFALLMALPRWWLQADPLRKRRVNLLGAGVIVLVALVVGLVSPFPQPWGMIVAGTMALSVQMAGAWQNPKGMTHVSRA